MAPLAVNCAVLVPVPVSVRVGGASVASVVMVAPALNVPNVSGVKATENVTVCPPATDAGRVGETSTKLLEVMAILLMLTG